LLAYLFLKNTNLLNSPTNPSKNQEQNQKKKLGRKETNTIPFGEN